MLEDLLPNRLGPRESSDEPTIEHAVERTAARTKFETELLDGHEGERKTPSDASMTRNRMESREISFGEFFFSTFPSHRLGVRAPPPPQISEKKSASEIRPKVCVVMRHTVCISYAKKSGRTG